MVRIQLPRPKIHPSRGNSHEQEPAPYDQAITEGSKAAGKFFDIVKDVGRPVANLYGLLIGDRVEAWRERNLDATARRTKQILKERNLAEVAPLAGDIAVPLLEAAQGDPRPEMRELWATLLANAMDPNRRNEVRREFIRALKMFHPTDAVVLKAMNDKWQNAFVAAHTIQEFALPDFRPDAIAVSLRNLQNNDCVHVSSGNYQISPFGTELVRACSIKIGA